ncbi:MAG: restriction endonuclease subunit S [Nitrososphaeria archaeon]|nr:restriction endonuclease subunit S [Nitrososphaeria archaeon]
MLKFRWETEFKEMETGEIPKEWDEKPLEEIIVDIQKGKTPQKRHGNLPYLSAKFLRGEEEPEGYYDKEAGVFVDENDIIILWDGSNSGEIFKGKKGLLASTMCKLILKEQVSKEFIYFVLKSKEDELKDAKSGTDDRHVDKDYFLTISTPYPHLQEQEIIASVLSWFDDLIENKKRQNEVLEKVAMTVFKSWFVDFEPFRDGEFESSELGEIPKGWRVAKLIDLSEIIMGQSPPSKYYNEDGEGLPFIQGKGQFGKYTPETTVYCSCEGKIAKPLDVLITVRAPVGELNIADRDYTIGRGVASLRSKYWGFVFCWLKQNNELIQAYQRGTTFEAITKQELDNFLILLPPTPTLEAFESIVELLFQKILLNQKQVMVLRKVRDTLLPLLVFGRLRVEEI